MTQANAQAMAVQATVAFVPRATQSVGLLAIPCRITTVDGSNRLRG
jgi:hypothetical protein